MLTISDVSVTFSRYTGRGLRRRRTIVLHDVSFTVGAGEIVVVTGESGAGKSLVADAVLGLLPANARATGTVELDGEPAAGHRGGRLRYLPQGTTHIDPLMRVGDFVGVSAPDPAAALARFGLGEETLRAYPHELSGGMLRRVLLATTVGPGCRILVADEPTSGLHPEAAAQVHDYFRELRDNGTGILLITHHLAAAAEIADRFVILRGGRIEQIAATPSEFTGYAETLWRAQPAHDFWEAL